MDGDDLASWFAQVLFLGLLKDKGDKVIGSLVGRNLVSLNTAAEVELSDDGEGDRASEDRDVWSVL